MTRRAATIGTLAALAAPSIRRAYAETSDVLIAKQFGLLYAQQDIMEQQRLIEKHASRLGLPNLKAQFVRLAGTGPVTDALLSGKLHFASGGGPGGMLPWGRAARGIKLGFRV